MLRLSPVKAWYINPGDTVDPHFLRQYQYDSDGNLPFNRLSIRSVTQGFDPVQFLVIRDNSDLEESLVSQQAELDLLVPPNIGQRLMAL